MLGDSFAFGWGVENDETFPHLLDQQLPDIEVINLGVTGFHLAQEHQLLKRHGLAYKPDLVVLALCQNDVCDQRIVPAAEVRRRRQESQAGFRAFVLRNCYLVDFLRLQFATARPLRQLLQSMGLKEEDAGYEALDPNLRPALKAYPPELQTEWDRSLRELSAIHETCRKAGIPLLVATVPTKESISAAALRLSLSYSKFAAADFDMQKPHAALARFCKAQGIGFLDGTPAISKLGGRAYAQHDMHFSPAAPGTAGVCRPETNFAGPGALPWPEFAPREC